MNNYFNYFTEIEEHFQRRRGTILLLSALDWALIETWKNAGIPLAAVLRGIDETFDKYDRRPSRTRKINSLGYCSQEVLAAAEEMKEAGSGIAENTMAAPIQPPSGFESAEVAAYLARDADELERAPLPAGASRLARDTVASLRELSTSIQQAGAIHLEDLERRLTVMEDKLMAALLASTANDQLLAVRSEGDREMATFRRNMSGPQIELLQKQYLHKRLFERYRLPRLSLFYM